jgi:hypothetical protein
MNVYVENIFILDLKKKFIDESSILDYDYEYEYSNVVVDYFEKKKLKDKNCYVFIKKINFGYEIYLIIPNYLMENEEVVDGKEVIEKYYENIIHDSKIKHKFKNNYNGEYLFHQHIFKFEKKYFNIEDFLKTSFILEKHEWSKYVYKENKNESSSALLGIELLSIDNFILQRHVMYEFFIREYLRRINKNSFFQYLFFIKIFYLIKDIKFLNKNRWLLSKHKLIMENFKVKVISYIENNKLFTINRVIRKKKIYEKIEKDFYNFIVISQQNLNNIFIIILTIFGILVTILG